MRIQLTGILRDGTKLDTTLNLHTPEPISINIASSLTIAICVIRPDGTPVSLTSTTVSLVLSVKKSSFQCGIQPGFKKTVTYASNATSPKVSNVLLFTIDPRDTQFLCPGQWVYDVWMIDTATDPPTRNCIVPLCKFAIGPSVTLP